MANLTSRARKQGEQEVIDAIERDLLGFVGYTAVEEINERYDDAFPAGRRARRENEPVNSTISS